MSVNLSLNFSNSMRPRTTSTKQTKMASGNAKDSRKGILNTPGEKYSSSLKEKPTGSTAFTKPEAIKMSAIRYRRIVVIMVKELR